MGLLLVSLLFVTSGTACVNLSAAGSQVKLTKAEPGPGCEVLGDVYGSGGGGGYTSAESKLRSAQNDIRNRAAQLGANYVVVDISAGDWASTTVSGRALWCEDVSEEVDGPLDASPASLDPIAQPAPRAAAAPALSLVPGAEPPDAAAHTSSAPAPGAGAQPAGPAGPAPSPEQRLRTLKALLDQGLVTQEEHDQRRKEILDSL